MYICIHTYILAYTYTYIYIYIYLCIYTRYTHNNSHRAAERLAPSHPRTPRPDILLYTLVVCCVILY